MAESEDRSGKILLIEGHLNSVSSLAYSDLADPPARREDNSDSKCCLYVGNLAYKLTNNEFRKEFERFGDLLYANIVYEP